MPLTEYTPSPDDLRPLLTTDRKNCLLVYTPDVAASSVDIAQALYRQYPTLAPSLQLIPHEGHHAIQILEVDKDVDKIVDDGLKLEQFHAKVFRLQYLSPESDLVEISLQNVLVGKRSPSLIAWWMRPYGRIVTSEVLFFGGTEMPTGEIRLVLDTAGASALPPARFSQEHTGYSTPVACHLISHSKWACDRCRALTHGTENCPQSHSRSGSERINFKRSHSSHDIQQMREFSSRPSSPTGGGYFSHPNSPMLRPLQDSSPMHHPQSMPLFMPPAQTWTTGTFTPFPQAANDSRPFLQGRPSYQNANYCTW